MSAVSHRRRRKETILPALRAVRAAIQSAGSPSAAHVCSAQGWNETSQSAGGSSTAHALDCCTGLAASSVAWLRGGSACHLPSRRQPEERHTGTLGAVSTGKYAPLVRFCFFSVFFYVCTSRSQPRTASYMLTIRCVNTYRSATASRLEIRELQPQSPATTLVAGGPLRMRYETNSGVLTELDCR